jgi:L-threonylcarbamoyladenylate synthase
VTESSDETRPLENRPAAAPDPEPATPLVAGPGPTSEAQPASEPEHLAGSEATAEAEQMSEAEQLAGSELVAGPEAAAETGSEPEPEPEREPVVVSAEDLPAAVESVRTAIRAGESVVFPTDTVYGIAANPFSPQAVQGLLDAKHRGRDMPPPVLIGDAEVLEAYTRDVPAAARLLANRYWPGPLTLILTAQSSLGMDLGETQGSIGVRVPDHEVARALLRATGPLAVSSANISGEPAATDATEARRQLGGAVAVYVDGGPTPGPTPSTIVDFASTLAGRVLRVGAIPLDELRKLLPGLEGPEPEPEPPAAEESADADGTVPEGETTGELSGAATEAAVDPSPTPDSTTEATPPATHETTTEAAPIAPDAAHPGETSH